MKGFIIFEDYKKLIKCKEILDGYYNCVINDYPNGTFSGVINRVTRATCNKVDTYDFETGALIALMKMCGSDKVVRACNEAFSYERDLHELRKENNHLRYIKSCNESTIESLENTRDLLINKNNELIEENKKLKDSCDKYFKEVESLVIKKNELIEENEKLKLDCEMLQHGYNDTEMLFYGGRQNGKQYTFLVKLFKKIPKDKVQAAYVAAYKESLIWCTSQPSIRDSLDKHTEQINKLTVDSLIEQSRAFRRKCIDEWLYKPLTKREEMWENIFELHKESDVIIKVKREDINTFLHELENKIPEITWASCVKIFETKYTIGDIYEELKTHDVIYFRLHEDNKLSYASDPHIYLYRENNHIEYLPPMRWDLFKKGRVVVKVDSNNYEDFYNKCEAEIGRKPHYSCKGTFTVYYSKGTFHTRPYDEKIPYKHKVVNWEDVR